MRVALLVAATELRRRIRNRSALLTAFVGPLALAIVFGVLLGNGAGLKFTIGVVDLDQSAIARGFTDSLLGTTGTSTGTGTGASGEPSDSPVTFREVSTEAEARHLLDTDTIDSAIIIPAGFGAAVSSGRADELMVLRDPSKEISGGIARSIADRFAGGISVRSLAAFTIIRLGGAPPSAAELAALDDTVTSGVTTSPPGGRGFDAAAYFGVSMSILFLFFTVSFASRSLITERANGISGRVLASGVSAGSIVVGKVIAVCVLGLAGFLTVWAVTSIGFSARWGSPGAVVATMVATVIAVGGVATFVSGFARTEQQADSYTSMVAFVLALVGGNFIGPGSAPAALERLSRFTPNGQAIDAFTRIANDAAQIGDVLTQLAILVAIGVVFGALGLSRAGRIVRR